MKKLEKIVTKKVIVCFYNLAEENFLKVAAFVIFRTSVRVKGHFLNELRVSFKIFFSFLSNNKWISHLREI